MPRDSWAELNAFIEKALAESIESCVRRPLSPEDYRACQRRIATLEEVRDKMKELIGNPNSPGEDV